MAISINWSTKVISIPQSYLSILGGGRYGLAIETFRNDLKNIEDSEEGMAFPNTHSRNAPVTLSGATYAQTFQILSPYSVSFENTGTPYTVVVSGANSNLGDVTNFDGGMSLVIGNSAGLIETGGGDPTVIADAVWNHVTGAAIATRLAEAWGRLGLDPSKPLVTGQTEISFGAIVMALTQSSSNITVTRQ